MVSVEQYFGENAGVVWRALKEKGALSAAQLKRVCRLSPAELYGGLGWLARENKVRIEGDKPLQYKFSLNGE